MNSPLAAASLSEPLRPAACLGWETTEQLLLSAAVRLR
jgi:hypothetical protein